MKLLVTQLPFGMSSKQLRAALSTAGRVTGAWVALGPAAKGPTRHGYAEVETSDDADRLVATFNGKVVLGHALTLAPVKRWPFESVIAAPRRAVSAKRDRRPVRARTAG